jgi:hypothetical protein
MIIKIGGGGDDVDDTNCSKDRRMKVAELIAVM